MWQERHVAYIAMEFLQGRELRDIMNDDGQLPVDQVLDIVAQVALGWPTRTNTRSCTAT